MPDVSDTTRHTYILLTSAGNARVYLRHTLEMFVEQVKDQVEPYDWKEVGIVPDPPSDSDWPSYVFKTPQGLVLGFGRGRAESIGTLLEQTPLIAPFHITIFQVCSVCPGEVTLARKVDPKNPNDLHVVPTTLTLRVLKPFTYQWATFLPGETTMGRRGCFPCMPSEYVPGGHAWYDRGHFIDPDTDQPWTHNLDGQMKDADTGKVLESLEGYIQVV